MNFKYKCLLQSFFSALPHGENLNYFCQKFLTKSLPIDDTSFLNKVRTASSHLEKFNQYGEEHKRNDLVYYEFGAGWDLVNPIALSLSGRFNKLLCIDIRELVFPALIQDTLHKFDRLKKEIPLNYHTIAVHKINKKNFRDILNNQFNIVYAAPRDACHTGIESGIIDLITSTVTFEHIPKNDIVNIALECFRILKPGGIFSISIDYQDHWSYFDHTISVYNFLSFSETNWKKFNPSLNYQNRLRDKDYAQIFRDSGFEIVEQKPIRASEDDLVLLRHMQLDPFFSGNYSIDELGIKGGNFVLKKN